MKKTSVLILLSIMSLNVCGKKTNYIFSPDYEYMSLSQGMDLKLKTIELSDTATTIYLTCKYNTATSVFFSRNIHLVDEQHKQYYIRNVDGASFDKEFHITANEPYAFKLVFAPLSKATKYFDFISSQKNINIFGIHRASTEIDIPILDPNYERITKWNQLICFGKAILKGKFDSDIPELFTLPYRNMMSGETNNIIVRVNKDGSFNTEVELDMPQIISFSINSRYYYTALCPDKTTCMDFTSQHDIRFSDSSPYCHLLNLLNWSNWGGEKFSNIRDGILGYLGDRFMLTPNELHLAFNSITIEKNLQHWEQLFKNNLLNGTLDITIKDLSFLKEYDQEDLSFLINERNDLINDDYLYYCANKESININDSIYHSNDWQTLIKITDSLIYKQASPSTLMIASF